MLHSINIPAAPAGYSYLAERDLLFIGGLILGPGPIDGSVDDWGLSILDFSSSAPNGFFFAYSPKTDGEFLAPFTFVISVTRITPVDEPGTLALLGLGLLGLDLTRRKRA